MSELQDSNEYAEIHRKLAAALADLVPEDPSIPPHPYLRRHLAQHAAQGHVLDDEHVPPALLPWETSATLRRLMATEKAHPTRHQWLQAWAKLEPFTGDLSPMSRLASLQLAHYAATSRHTPRSMEASTARPFTGPPVTPLWSDCASADNVWAVTGAVVTSLTALSSADGREVVIVTGDDYGVVRVLRQDGTAAAPPMSLHQGAVTHLLVLPGGQIVTGSTDGTLSVLDPFRGHLVKQVHRRDSTWISSLTLYQPPNRPTVILAAHNDGHVAVLNLAAFQPVSVRLPRFERSSVLMQGVQLPDGSSVLLYAQHDTVSYFDGRNAYLHSRHPALIRAIAALPSHDGLYAVSSEDGNLSIFDLTTGNLPQVANVSLNTRATILGVVDVNDHNVLASAAVDGTVRLWEIPTLSPIHEALPGHSAPVSALTSIHRSRQPRLITAGFDRTVRSWPLVADTFQDTASAWNPIKASALSPHAPYMLATAEATRTLVWNIETGHKRLLLEQEPVTALTWIPMGGRLLLAAATSDNSITLLDSAGESRPPITLKLRGHYSPPLTLVPLVDEFATLLASGSADGTVRLWDLQNETAVAVFPQHKFSVRCLASLRTDRGILLASGGSDGNLRVWDVRNRSQKGPTIRCGQNIVNDVAFFPSRDTNPCLATVGQDGTLKLWNTGAPSEPMAQFDPGYGELNAVTSFTTSGRRTVFVVASSTSIHLWDATTSRPILQVVTGYPINALKLAPLQDADDVSPVLLATGEAGTMIIRLDGNRL